MKKSLAIIILGLSFCAVGRTETSTPATIGKITFDNRDIFDTAKPEENHFVFRAANAVHIQTREDFLRRELLVKEGDVYDAALVDETERNLRRFNFLRDISIERNPQPDGTVNLIVHSKDTWTLEPQADFNRVGGQNNVKVGMVERNLLGEGKTVSAFYNKSTDQTGPTFAFRDPQFLNRHIELTGGYVKGNEFRSQGLSISRPFFATTAQWSAAASHFFEEEEKPVYQNGVELGRFEKESRTSNIALGRSLLATREKTRRLSFGFAQESTEYSPIDPQTSGFLSPSRDLSIISTVYSGQNLDFIQERHIQKFDRVEDINLGREFDAGIGVGRDRIGSHLVEVFPSLRWQRGHSWSDGHFGMGRFRYKSRFDRKNTYNLVATGEGEYYKRFSMRQTFAARLAFDHGHHLDPDQQLLLGEDTGLRGYKVGQFAGDRRVLLNLEQRVFFKDDAFHLISLGAVGFFDSGYAWPHAESISPSDVRSSIGLGFRLAFSRSTRNEPIRFDLAYALNNNNANSRFVFSVQTGTAFGSGAARETIKP